MAGFLQVRSKQGLWRLRIDDLDTPRNLPHAADAILTTLEAFGLYWDGEVYYQSRHVDIYQHSLNELQQNNLLYPCTCSRTTLAVRASGQEPSDIYPGICRDRQAPTDDPHALRIKTDHRLIVFQDQLQGLISDDLAAQHGDFIVKRKDQIIAYQFAVVIDDDLQQVNHIVRGFDLLDATPKQIYLQQLLGLATPGYMHVPVIVDEQGYKLSKQTQATAVDLTLPSGVIFALLGLLKQTPPVELQHAPVHELLSWAIAHWNPAGLKNAHAVRYE